MGKAGGGSDCQYCNGHAGCVEMVVVWVVVAEQTEVRREVVEGGEERVDRAGEGAREIEGVAGKRERVAVMELLIPRKRT